MSVRSKSMDKIEFLLGFHGLGRYWALGERPRGPSRPLQLKCGHGPLVGPFILWALLSFSFSRTIVSFIIYFQRTS